MLFRNEGELAPRIQFAFSFILSQCMKIVSVQAEGSVLRVWLCVTDDSTVIRLLSSGMPADYYSLSLGIMR